MNAGKLLILLMFIMVLVWYTAIWTIVIKRVRADTDLSDFTMKTIQNGGDCLRKSKADDRLLVHYVIKIYETDSVIESSTNADSPYIVHLGQYVDIPTLERGLFDMCEQESRSIVVPPLLGYGVKDSQTKQGNLVPGNSTLQYDVTLVKIFSKEASETNKDTINDVKPSKGQGGTESAGADVTTDQTTDPSGDTTQSEEAAIKEKDKQIVENVMEDAMNAVFPDQKDSGGLAGMIGGMLGGGGGSGGMAGLMGQLAGAMGKGGTNGGGEGMAGLMGQLAGAMGKGGTDGEGEGMAGLMGQLAGAMGKGGTNGGGEGMAGLVSKLAGAMGGGGAGAGGMEGLIGQLAGAMGNGGEGGMDGLMGKLSGLMGGGAGGQGGMDGQLGGDSGVSFDKINDAISKMIKKQKKRLNRRKTEL